MSIAAASVHAFTAAVAAANSVDLTAYTLRAGAVRDALTDAARAGARVRVRLERDPLDDPAGTLHAANADTVAVLGAAGADAALTPAGSPVLHLKAAVVDGVAWLDDRNWAGDGPQTLLRDSDADDVNAVAAALDGAGAGNAHLRTTKAGALALEADLIRGAGAAPVAVESESFGAGVVYDALLARARAGLPARLLVAGREAAAPGAAGDAERRRLAHLAGLGVEIRTGAGRPGDEDFDEKLAVAGGRAWAGSANATYAREAAGEQRDWGLAIDAPPLIDALRAEFERNWAEAQPVSHVMMGGLRCSKRLAIISAIRPPAPSCAPPSISASTSR